ncbi:serine-rich adhesin for platelets [Eurosta solidaginis]|uniref:serine-rich adhesin for platelets n=1 Tax=Eurosta solidaginis TaxID=178769 RepID=UPI003530F3B0
MDAVVLHSDIARLVLGYLKRQNLDRTSRSFCKTSPHLKQELTAYQKGFTPHSFCPDLEDIICEYVNITRTVERILSSLPKSLRLHLFEHKLCEKVKFLLERALDSYLQTELTETDTIKKNGTNQSSNASTSLHSDKENSTKKQNKHKRRHSSILYSSDDRKSPVHSGSKPTKRRRVLEPFCYLSSKQVYTKRQRKTCLNTSSTGEEQTPTDEEYEDESANEEENGVEDEEINAQFDDTSISIIERPTKESTPRNKTAKGTFLGPSLPELSQAILDNPQFQMKLVDNINQALSNSTSNEAQLTCKNQKTNICTEVVNVASTTNALTEEQQIINSNEMLDQMVKDILKATENDPTFDAIIENVVGATIQPSNVSAGVQCRAEGIAPGPMLNMPTAPIMAAQQQQFALVQQPQTQQQHHLTTIPSLSTVSHQITETASASSVPRTPLIIRTAVAAASSSLNVAGETQILSTLNANNSFGSLMDPNFSISKLIVLNPNESAQKQAPSADQSIGNSTADHIINQFTGVEGSSDEQVYFDANTGQLTIPLFLTDEGLLTNFPFLINNEAVTQQLQPDNICNLDGSHIEIPLPEPIIVSADQLPPNSIIVTSAQKAVTSEEHRLQIAQLPQTECKKLKNVLAPTSLDVRLNSDRETPSTSGIQNTKGYRSLSTPRKRTSHVRTLSFSPKAEGSSQPVLTGTTPLSTRRCVAKRETTTVAETEVNRDLNHSTDISIKPIIKNVEILPRLSGDSTIVTTASAIDVSANESSNSCSVPPLFVNEESSNQTVIKTELSLKENQNVSLMNKSNKEVRDNKADTKRLSVSTSDHVDTPKRKQVRRTAVRACKRQISKSSDEGDKKLKVTSNESENEDKTKITTNCDATRRKEKETKLDDDKMMEEWLRLRNASTSDLDSRLRQLNAASTAVLPKSGRRKKDTPVKRRKLRRKKPVNAKSSLETLADVAAGLEHEGDIKKCLNASAEDKNIKVESECDHKSKSDMKVVEKTPKRKGKKRSSKDRYKEFNIKIPTPQKDKRESAMKMKSERTTYVSPDLTLKDTNDTVDNNTKFQIPTKRVYNNAKPAITEERLEQERDRRTANIACLLETPFKAPTPSNEIPPTPGIPLLDTPAAKLDVPTELHSTSYLFGSLTKSDLETPQLSAITPGLRFTPFGSSRDVTPRSTAPATDYSSGGSYYKPDESDDLDKNLDKILKDSGQKRKEEVESRTKAHVEHSNDVVAEKTTNVEQKEGAFCVEIPAEKLRVEPIVLKRVKSFGAEGTENSEGGTTALNINPHYTLVSELPEICAEEESSNNSSTLSNSSSSSTDSSSSSSSLSLHSVAESLEEGEVSSSVVENLHKTPDKLSLSLDNLSTISSTEDEEWQKLAVTEEENSQLVSNDGEVRYPVRSWLTPSKVDKQTPADETRESALPTTIKVTVPLKSAEKRNRLEDDLQRKRERMMEKLKQDSSQRRDKSSTIPSTSPSGITASSSVSRRLAAMREKPAKTHQSLKTKMPATTSATTVSKIAKPVTEVEERRTMDVLTALQLSAKKPATRQPAAGVSKPMTTAVAPPLGACDDNAVSTIFPNTPAKYELTEKTERLPIKTLISKVKAKQRKCLQIEALPVLKTSRASSLGRKKIVRNPLGFKGTIKPPDALEQLEEVKSPLKVVMTSTAGCEEKEEETDNDSEVTSPKVSPVPRIKIKTAAGSNVATCSKQRVSPRLRLSKETETRGDDDDAVSVPKQQSKRLKITKLAKGSATHSRKFISGRIKVATAKTQAKSKKAGKANQIEKEKLDPDQAKRVDKGARVKFGREKIQKKKDAKEEQPTSNVQKMTKTLPKQTSDKKLDKDEHQNKSKDITLSKEVVEEIEINATNIVRPNPTAKGLTEKGIENTIPALEEEPPRPTSAVTASDTKSKTGEADDKLKTKNRNEPKINAQSTRKENINIPPKSSGEVKEVSLQKEKVQKSSSPNVENTPTNSECRATPTSTTNVETASIEISEDDPLECCERTTVTEEDLVHFISVRYDGPDVAPTNPLPRRDFSNFKMVVAFDENEKHIWRISEELVLFNASPFTQQIRNIPKKRRVRIDTCGSEENYAATVGVVHSTTMTTPTITLPSTTPRALVVAAVASGSSTTNNKSSSQDKPVVISTPIAGEGNSSSQETKKPRTKQATSSADKKGEAIASTSATSPPVGTTEVLQMDDIESLLSHLHGTEK